eukprot:5988884-Prymnesium_polylepis.1
MPDSVLLPALAAQPLLVTVMHGAPRVHISSVRLLGRLSVEGGDLTLTDCRMEAMGHRLDDAENNVLGDILPGRALSIRGGHAALVRSVLRGHPSGAIGVHEASLILIESIVERSRAQLGGAILIDKANVTIAGSLLAENAADVSGGALQVTVAT